MAAAQAAPLLLLRKMMMMMVVVMSGGTTMTGECEVAGLAAVPRGRLRGRPPSSRGGRRPAEREAPPRTAGAAAAGAARLALLAEATLPSAVVLLVHALLCVEAVLQLRGAFHVRAAARSSSSSSQAPPSTRPKGTSLWSSRGDGAAAR